MTEQPLEDVEATISPAENLGAMLRKAREARGLSVQDVSNSLRFSVKQIEALENSAFELFPDAMMTRGFIRSYAKYLEIDAEPLLAVYRSSSGEDSQKKVIAIKSSMRPVELSHESWPWLKYILATIVVLLFLLAWMIYVEFMPHQSETSAETDAGAEHVQKSTENSIPLPPPAVPEAALPAAERVSDMNVGELTGEVMQDSTATQATDSASSFPAKTPAEKPATTPVSSGSASSLSASGSADVPAASSKTISFSFTGQSWVSVKDKTGKVIYEKLGQAGAQETVTAVPPLTLVIGNATDTAVQVSGQPLDFSSNIKNNVARITLE